MPTTSPNGDAKLKTARQKVEEFTKGLEIFMTNNGLPNPTPRHIDHYINMPRSELSLLPADAIEEIAYEIASYSYYLQNLQNKQTAKAEKCKSEIDLLIGHLLSNYSVYGSAEKRMAAIHDNEHAREFQAIETNARIAISRTSYLTARLENLHKTLLALANTKRRQYA